MKFSSLLPRLIILVGFMSISSGAFLTYTKPARAQEVGVWSSWKPVSDHLNLEYRYRPNGNLESSGSNHEIEFRGTPGTKINVTITSKTYKDGAPSNDYEWEETFDYTLKNNTVKTTGWRPVVTDVRSQK